MKKAVPRESFTVDRILARFKKLHNPRNIEGMARFGIKTDNCFGISIPTLRSLAKGIGRNQSLSLALWRTGIHEARILAGFIGDLDQVSESQMDDWVKDFDSWDVCDQVCGNLFDRTPWAWRKALVWSRRKEEFVRRAGFVLMATLAVHDKEAADSKFLPFLARIEDGSDDDRNFVRKAVNWALRQIGKRNRRLHPLAVATAKKIKAAGSKAGRWIAADALRELESAAVISRLRGQ